METKKCSECGEVKPTCEYHKRTRNKSGLQSNCKICVNRYSKKWRSENSEYNKERCRNWVKNNPEKRKNQLKSWYDRNRDKEIERRKEHRKAHPDLEIKYDKEKTERLPDYLVRKRLKALSYPPELWSNPIFIDCYRANIKLKRTIRERA